jgi:hypothetical protein
LNGTAEGLVSRSNTLSTSLLIPAYAESGATPLRPQLLVIVAIFVGCSSPHEHANVKVKATHGWEAGRAKHCMLLTGRSVVRGGKAGPDPKEMLCNDQKKSDPDDMEWEYVRISNISLDATSETTFHNSENWAVPLLCQEQTSSELKCIFDKPE